MPTAAAASRWRSARSLCGEGPSSHSIPSQRRSATISSTAPSTPRPTSVSSIRSRSQSPRRRFATAERALPRWSEPVGLGAKRTRTLIRSVYGEPFSPPRPWMICSATQPSRIASQISDPVFPRPLPPLDRLRSRLGVHRDGLGSLPDADARPLLQLFLQTVAVPAGLLSELLPLRRRVGSPALASPHAPAAPRAAPASPATCASCSSCQSRTSSSASRVGFTHPLSRFRALPFRGRRRNWLGCNLTG